MNEITVSCPNCGRDNHFFPSRIVNIGALTCIKCGGKLPLSLYDEQLSHGNNPNQENDIRK